MATVKTRIGLADHGRRMTLDEFHEADEEPGYLYELARGVVEVSEVPAEPHLFVIHNLHQALSAYSFRNPRSIALIGRAGDVRIIAPDIDSDRHPDLAVLFRDAPRDARGRHAPGLVVEVVSPGKVARVRDYEEKREEYLTYGLGEYWIVDPAEHAVTVLVRADGPSWIERRFEGSDRIISDLLPDLGLTADQLWIEAEFDDVGSDTP